MASRHFYMIGSPVLGYKHIDQIPSLTEVLKDFIFYHYEQMLGVYESAKKTCEKLRIMLQKKIIPMKKLDKMIKKLKQHYYDWQFSNKHKKRKSKLYEDKRKELMSSLHKEFKIGVEQAPKISKKVKSVVQNSSVRRISPSREKETSSGKRHAFEEAIKNLPYK